MTDIKQKVGQQIREAREKKGLSQREFAERLGVTVGTANQYEVGKQNLTLTTLEKIADALDVPFTVFIG